MSQVYQRMAEIGVEQWYIEEVAFSVLVYQRVLFGSDIHVE